MKKGFAVLLAAVLLVAFAGVSVSASGLIKTESYFNNLDYTDETVKAQSELEEDWELASGGGVEFGDDRFGIADDALFMTAFSGIRYKNPLKSYTFSYKYKNAGGAATQAGHMMTIRSCLLDGPNLLYEAARGGRESGTGALGRCGIGLYMWDGYADVVVITYDEENCEFDYQFLGENLPTGGNCRSGFVTVKVVDNGEGHIDLYANDAKFFSMELSGEKEVISNVDPFMAYTKISGGGKTIDNVLVAADEATVAFGKRAYNGNAGTQYIDDLSLEFTSEISTEAFTYSFDDEDYKKLWVPSEASVKDGVLVMNEKALLRCNNELSAYILSFGFTPDAGDVTDAGLNLRALTAGGVEKSGIRIACDGANVTVTAMQYDADTETYSEKQLAKAAGNTGTLQIVDDGDGKIELSLDGKAFAQIVLSEKAEVKVGDATVSVYTKAAVGNTSATRCLIGAEHYTAELTNGEGCVPYTVDDLTLEAPKGTITLKDAEKENPGQEGEKQDDGKSEANPSAAKTDTKKDNGEKKGGNTTLIVIIAIVAAVVIAAAAIVFAKKKKK